MFNLAIDSKLRGCDLIRMKIEDVSIKGRVRERGSVMQKKTSKPVQFEITEKSSVVLQKWIDLSGRQDGYLFPTRYSLERPLSTRTYARIVELWVRAAGLEPRLYGTHTLRRTKATYLYRKTGNLRAVQLLLGHKSIENTVRYLGIDVDDALELAGQIDF
jgi:integrase